MTKEGRVKRCISSGLHRGREASVEAPGNGVGMQCSEGGCSHGDSAFTKLQNLQVVNYWT